MRCGKPCGPGETMCEECKAWFTQQTAGDARQKSFKKVRMPGRGRDKEEQTTKKPISDAAASEQKVPETAGSADNDAGGQQFCPKCGKKLPASAKFCTGCGNSLDRMARSSGNVQGTENSDTASDEGTQITGNQNGSDTGAAAGSGIKKIIIAAVALVLVVALIFGVKMILGSKSGTKGTQNASSSEGSNGNGIGKVVEEESEEEKAAKEQAEKEKAEKEQREKEEAERARKEQEAKEQAEREAKEKAERELAIHNYEIVISDCTWQQAYDDCKNRGGYLVRINSADEYRHIVGMLQNYSKIHFYLGGRRNADGQEYYWVDNDGAYMEECLNPANSWTSEFWFRNEPSYVDAGSGAQGRDVEEAYMNLFCVSGTWYLNDSSGNLAGDYPSLLAGKVGYIVEYE